MTRNTLFAPWKRNAARRSAPLGRWTMKHKEAVEDARALGALNEEDEEDGVQRDWR